MRPRAGLMEPFFLLLFCGQRCNKECGKNSAGFRMSAAVRSESLTKPRTG